MKKWKCLVFAGLAVLLLAPASNAQDHKRIGGRVLLSYNLPLLGLRDNWYLDPSQILPAQEDRRAALGVNFGFGVERFFSKHFALDFRAQYNFLVGNLSPREAWGVNGVWPIWVGDDGAWAEGPSYRLAYVRIMTMFATALKQGAGVDLYRRRFWKNHARWRQYCLPPYAEWMGFGDHTERWAGTWRSNADLVDLIGRETETGEFAQYVDAFREEAAQLDTPAQRKMPGASSQLYLGLPAKKRLEPDGKDPIFRAFPAAGWAAVRTHLNDPARDVALIFRSSPLGAVSHSHANNNDFILHAGGKVMAMPSGYYVGYGSDHHAHWVWHTKSHNCVTLSDASQIMRSHNSLGAIENAFEDERLVYFRGNADASYSDRADRCRRHVFFLKAQTCFVMIDEFVAAPGIDSALQWNIHSWNRFTVDEAARIGDTLVLVSQGEAMAYDDHSTDGLALLVVQG